MPCQLKVTRSGEMFLAGPHPSTGEAVVVEVSTPRFPINLKTKSGAPLVFVTKPVGVDDKVFDLKGDLFQNAKRLGVKIPRPTKPQAQPTKYFGLVA